MTRDLKPVPNGGRVCVLGGGPGGSACAIALKREAAALGKNIEVVILEQKKFEEDRQYNQCIGVLSPPLEDILKEQLGVALPKELVVKKIDGYCLHTDHCNLPLIGDEHGDTYAVKRSKFDAFMLREAEKAGAVVLHNRATEIEFSGDGVLIYTEGENCPATVVVGAFGLDDGTCKIFEQATAYRQPDFLNTIITKLYPGQEFLDSMGPVIQAFILSYNGLEFGAVTPKDNHLSINVAGRKVSAKIMMEFLRSAPVQRFMPQQKYRDKPLNYFKGKFPIAPAKNLYGDRYVTIGDAAGLIRPFKGKGINSACLTGIYAARTIIRHGVSKQAFDEYYIKDCAILTDDLPYGRALRWLTKLSTHFKFMDYLVKIAEDDPVFMECLFNCVSGHKPYKNIIRETVSIPLAFRIFRELCNHFILRKRIVKTL